MDEIVAAAGYREIRRLGAGGMGVVYEVEDRRGRRVALKTIHARDPELLYRLKREFRALAGLSHRNLISLHDLVIEDGASFITMELVRGVDLVSWCRGAAPSAGGGDVPASPRPAEDVVARVRAALPQLLAALRALHGAEKVHRDLKPSNVLVTEEGRVVVLDFGLAADVGRGSLDTVHGSSVVSGTAEYMAPEQASGTSTPACDLYAVGVLLYEALTGALPFSGSIFEVLIEKNRRDARSPGELAPGLPRDLESLCVDLLARDPAARPTAAEALARLGGEAGAPPPPVAEPAASAFAGRERETETLLRAFRARESGRAAVALVLGPSGIGKSTLVREALDRVRALRADAVALEGRCYERERVPFRAFDGLVDHLAHVWRRLPAAEQAAILPREASALPRLFPVLARVPAVAEAPDVAGALAPREARARAVAALRETLQRLADRHPLVLVLDDLQWVDPGTVALVSDLLRPPDPPRVLLVLSARQEAAPVLERLAAESGGEVRRVDVGPLPEDAAERLARAWLGDDAPEGLARRVASEAQGNPYFLGELARHVRATGLAAGGSGDLPAVRLERVLEARIDELDPASRRLLEVVAVAGEPLDEASAAGAASIEPEHLPRRVAELRAARLLRAAAGAGDALLEPYHDRITRTAISGLSDPRRRDRHAALAAALEGSGDDERLARHWAEAGNAARGAGHARAAADAALATHHFDHAADLYRTTLDLAAPTGPARRDLLVRLAGALENAGRCVEAGDAYLEAATGAGAEESLDLRRRAAEQLLVGGDVGRGIATFEACLRDVGQRLPRSPRRALLSVVADRARLRLRGLAWTAREASEIPSSDLVRLDVTLAGALGLGLVDNIRGAVFQTRALRMALATGERRRVGRSLALEAVFRTSQGTKGRARAEPLIAAASRIAEEAGDAYLLAWVGLARSFASYCAGDYPAAVEGLSRTEERFRTETVGTTWELNNARIFQLQALRYHGEWGRLADLFDRWLRDARRRGDRYAETMLRRALNGTWLARDDVAGAKAALDVSTWSAPEGGFHIQHWYGLRARSEIALYEGAVGPGALDAFDALERSMLTRVQTIRAESLWLRGRLRLAGGGRGGDGARDALALARRLDLERTPYASAWGTLLRAGAGAVAWRDAAAQAEAAHLLAASAAARLRSGNSGAVVRLRALGVGRPERFAGVVATASRAREGASRPPSSPEEQG